MIGRRDKKDEAERMLEVDASMQGSLIFKDPVNLRINGRFEGMLNTKGSLTIGEHAVVHADITGETVVVAGRVSGNIIATLQLKLVAPACVVGNVKTPLLVVAEGAILEGHCKMLGTKQTPDLVVDQTVMTSDELAKYLEIDLSLVSEWANMGKIPATREGSSWRFERSKIDEWVATEKIK